MSDVLQPADWARPRGYSHGIASGGRYIAVAGQIGWNESGKLVAEDFTSQAAQALRNVVTILKEAGADPKHLVRLTWYVTDKREYLAEAHTLGRFYREIIGDYFPAMTLVEVSALLEEGARVEIEATAILPE
ncbi:MAG: RidA family protein [Vulcanimicrobiaceae bacterium]